ncbi:tRNA (cytosine(34)-C(5))-methyltransferase [Tetrabaena socialis]|uniref:tRNA (Cytosine(34)-C(5))-methyltransferase n=1 Tax=Tetrabaena socialis TaxID=47790 RepID=A0A2J7ZWJ9_9CHLO|nr:tRNA (cytosine(34)-C(5))-methyltransferase [Tetrabaena socialis]|eukprot:PNH04625.1 tRNA (cytosine(34)-C(5))-methyltransferase [Tetrabaena socialis]
MVVTWLQQSMRLGLAMGEAVLRSSSAPSTSGRGSASSSLRDVAPALAAALSRGFASLVGSGVPSPRHDVAVQLSTPHGGHINRLIMTSESIAELDGVLYRFRRELRPANIGAAAVQLAYLQRCVRRVLDLCAAPGSKTFQLLEALHAGSRPGQTPSGLVVANDADFMRCNLLTHQTKRVCSPCLLVTNHDAARLPVHLAAGAAAAKAANHAAWAAAKAAEGGDASASATSASADGAAAAAAAGGGGGRVVGRRELRFDRILADVPCSGDGTLRKSPDIWRRWNISGGNSLHGIQLRIALHGARMLEAASLSSLPALSPGQLVGLLLGVQRLRCTAGCRPPHLPPQLLAAAEAHLRAAAPELELLQVKRAAQALAPTAAAQAAEAYTAAPAGAAGAAAAAAAASPAGPLLDLLARRALQLLPPAEPAQALSPGAGIMARLPRGGAGAGTVLAAVAGPPALDGATLGVLEGLARAYAAAAAAPLGSVGEGGVGEGEQGRARVLGAGVVALFERVAALAAAGRARGLLWEAQRASLGRSLAQLLGERAAAPLLEPGVERSPVS